jgi:hypothetical protein
LRPAGESLLVVCEMRFSRVSARPDLSTSRNAATRAEVRDGLIAEPVLTGGQPPGGPAGGLAAGGLAGGGSAADAVVGGAASGPYTLTVTGVPASTVPETV